MRVYLIPAILALLSLVGLILALVYEGLLEVLSSIAVSIPIAVMLFAVLHSQNRGPRKLHRGLRRH